MIHELLKKRYSTRAFADKKVEPEKIINLLEAARWSPSSMNGRALEICYRFKTGHREF